MKNLLTIVAITAVAYGQSNASRPRFLASDVHPVPVHGVVEGVFHVPPVRGDRYELTNATMLDLIQTAYSVHSERVVGGPGWIALDRFDVAAKLPPDTAPDNQKLMLQTLLEDRFKLAVHSDTKPMTGYALKIGRKFALKGSSGGGGQGGCTQQYAATMGVGLPVTYHCRDVAAKSFTKQLPDMLGTNLGNTTVADETGLEGGWTFDLTWTIIANGTVGEKSANPITTIFDALDKLGFQLEKTSIPTPVLVVDRVSRTPTENSADLARVMPPIPPPTHFEVASVKLSTPLRNGPPIRFQGHQITIRGLPMRGLLEYAFRDNRKAAHTWIDGIPGWAEANPYFDIQAEAPANTALMDQGNLALPLVSLLMERFGLAYHVEQRPKNAYTLDASGPKLQTADPAARMSCGYSPAPAKSPGGPQMLRCRNMTMPQFAEWLTDHAMGLAYGPVADSTGIKGAWDFSITFALTGFGPPSEDPMGGYDMFEALKKQAGLTLRKVNRAQPVVVIDRVEQKPTGN